MENATGVRWMIPPPYPFPDQWAEMAHRAQRGDVDAQRWLTFTTPVSRLVGHTGSSTAALHEASVQHPPPPPTPSTPVFPATAHSPATVYRGPVGAYRAGGLDLASQDESEEEEDEEDVEEDDEYEYGYVLRDEWRTYLRETVLSDGDEDEGGDDDSDRTSSDGLSFSPPRRRQPPGKTQRNHRNQTKPSTTRAQRKQVPSTVRLTGPLELALEDARTLEKQRRHERRALVDDHAAWQRIDSMETALHAQFEAFCDHHAPAVWPQGAS